MNFMD